MWGRARGEGGWGRPARWGRSCFAKLTQPFRSPGLRLGGGCRGFGGVPNSKNQKMGTLRVNRSISKARREGGAEVQPSTSARAARGVRTRQVRRLVSVGRCAFRKCLSLSHFEKCGTRAGANLPERGEVGVRYGILPSRKFGAPRGAAERTSPRAFCIHSFLALLLPGFRNGPSGKSHLPWFGPSLSRVGR